MPGKNQNEEERLFSGALQLNFKMMGLIQDRQNKLLKNFIWQVILIKKII